jgi:hypothetical protein
MVELASAIALTSDEAPPVAELLASRFVIAWTWFGTSV